MKEFWKILNRPFPTVESNREKIAISIFFGVFIFLFLAVFQPFGLETVKENSLLYFGGYGLITTVVILFNSFITIRFFKDFFAPEKWNVWKSFVDNLIMIIPIALLNWLYFVTVDKPDSINYSFTNFIFMTIAVGFFPSMFLIFYLERKLRNENETLSEKVNEKIADRHNENKKSESLILIPDLKITDEDFLCAKAIGNYVTFYYKFNGKIKKHTSRVTMKKIEENLNGSDKIIRCHKSYFVNLDKATSTSGNARSLFLHIKELDFPVPVSRKVAKSIISRTF